MQPSRTLIIGDVHGCADELKDLLQACQFTSDDKLVFVGDLVAKGPKSPETVSLARLLGARTVLGNHDVKVLAIRQALQAEHPVPSATQSQLEAAKGLSSDDIAWLASQPFYLTLPEHSTWVVHGGLVPGRPLSEQEPAHLTTMRSLLPDGHPSKHVTEGVPWASQWLGPELVVFGHDAIRGLQRYPFAFGLDTGCVYGGDLTALILPGRELISVPAHRAYLPRGKDEP
jgi:hypothetical protein